MSPGGAGGGGSQPLANLVVQFVQQGQKELKAAFDDMQMAIGAVVLSINKMNADMTKAMSGAQKQVKDTAEQTGKLKAAFDTVRTSINVALGAGVGIVANFVRQGVAASSMGQVLGFQMERLSRIIAGMFRPEIEKITSGVEKFNKWLSSLSNEQKASIARWIQGAAAALGMAVVFGRISALIPPLIAGVRALGAAIMGMEVDTGIGAILPIIGLLLEGITALLVGTESGREALSEIWGVIKKLGSAIADLFEAMDMQSVLTDMADGFIAIIKVVTELVGWVAGLVKQMNALTQGNAGKALGWLATIAAGPAAIALRLAGTAAHEIEGKKKKKKTDDLSEAAPRLGGFESLDQTYQRIAVASIRATTGVKSPEERTANATEAALGLLGAIRGGIEGQRPMVAR